ncbi:MAG: nitric-oxide reductase large subunit [Tannerella sp.]|jgi:nitric oxide reductase subunit B|nr:nitric-oxide reductase large subunit [Tannerella sp.]
MSKEKKLWILFASVVIVSFAVLGYYGHKIYQQAPPIPDKIVSAQGDVIFTKQDIQEGQNIWQSTGGQEIGSIWGHGAYVAPDWTADWLHREAVFLLDRLAQRDFGKPYNDLDEESQAVLKVKLQKDLRTNTYDPNTKTTAISDDRIEAIKFLSDYYRRLFMDDPQFNELRENYAMPANTIKDPERMRKMNAFFFWATWATVTERPGEDVSYTHNWPPDELVGNTVTKDLLLWSGISVILLLFFIGILVFYYVQSKEEDFRTPAQDPLIGEKVTASMRFIKPYLVVVGALMLVQVGLGILAAHYGVEGNGLYGIPLAEILPYSVARTWHLQLGIFWIATAWLAMGLYVAPALTGKDPKFQVFGVNFLFIALLIIVVGSLAGEWMGVMQKLNPEMNFWFGHQGYEYVDLGRFWQLFLFVGLLVWLVLMIRPVVPFMKANPAKKSLMTLFLISCLAIGLFYGAGLMWGQHTSLTIAEYWRWWVVHLWVEGFFEVFATVVIAFLFVRLGLLSEKLAITSSLLTTAIYLSGGILGTFHHLYFAGTSTVVMAIGACFSALEVVPLTIVGFEAYKNYRASKVTQWIKDYKWPIYFLVSVGFWNFLGAGVFGFLINPPASLYFVQGLNTTPLHGHTALFGVYGMLGIAFVLFVLRSMYRDAQWSEKLMKIFFWGLNVGLLLMGVLSLLPVGIWQAVESIDKGMWYARSAELMQQPGMVVLRWMRVVGDTIFAVGLIAGVWFMLKLILFSKKSSKGAE